MAELIPINRDLTPQWQAVLETMLKPIVDRFPDRVTMQGILRSLRAGDSQAYAVVGPTEVLACVILRVLTYPTGVRVMRIDQAAGTLPLAVAFLPELERIAKEQRCTRLAIEGRKGWVDVLPGFVEVSRRIEKEI